MSPTEYMKKNPIDVARAAHDADSKRVHAIESIANTISETTKAEFVCTTIAALSAVFLAVAYAVEPGMFRGYFGSHFISFMSALCAGFVWGVMFVSWLTRRRLRKLMGVLK